MDPTRLLFPALRRLLTGKTEAERTLRLDTGLLDLGKRVSPQSLGTLLLMLEKKAVVTRTVRQAFVHDHAWILGELPHCLRRIVEIRNPAAHSGSATRDAVGQRRREILGIGVEGTIPRIARVKLRS